MNTYESYSPRGFYRSADRAVLGGVCAGIADHFGFNLRVLRILAVIACCVAMPMTVIAYLAIVFLIPARDGAAYFERPAKKERISRKERRKACKQAREEVKAKAQAVPSAAAAVVRDRCQSMDARLAKLEKYITSSRYKLDQEFKNL